MATGIDAFTAEYPLAAGGARSLARKNPEKGLRYRSQDGPIRSIVLKTDILILPFTALLAGGAFAVGLAFALGARPIVTHVFAGHFLKQSLPRDRFVEIDGERGVVERIGPTDTLFKNGERRWSVPNAQLLERVVLH